MNLLCLGEIFAVLARLTCEFPFGPLHPLLHRESTYLVCMSMAYELHDVCSFHFFSTSWSHESVDSLEAAGAADTVASRASPRPSGCSTSWDDFELRQLLLVFSVQRLICAAYFPLLHTEAAVVALEAEVAADHTPARRTSGSVFSVYIFLTDQILQLVGQPRRWKNESVDETDRFESDLHPLT